MTTVNCYGCRHFSITYEPTRPYACRAFGFKTQRLPAIEVMQSSGSPCVQRQPVTQAKRSARA